METITRQLGAEHGQRVYDNSRNLRQALLLLPGSGYAIDMQIHRWPLDLPGELIVAWEIPEPMLDHMGRISDASALELFGDSSLFHPVRQHEKHMHPYMVALTRLHTLVAWQTPR